MKNLEGLRAPKSTQNLKRTDGQGQITIVNSRKNGNRIELLKPLTDLMEIEDEVKIGFIENALILFPVNAEVSLPIFSLKKVGTKKVIYSASLVQEIAEVLQLNFSTRVSYTISNAEIDEAFGVDAVFVKGDV